MRHSSIGNADEKRKTPWNPYRCAHNAFQTDLLVPQETGEGYPLGKRSCNRWDSLLLNTENGKKTDKEDLGPPEALYLDLELPSDRAKLTDPEPDLGQHEDKLVIIDELLLAPGPVAVYVGKPGDGKSLPWAQWAEGAPWARGRAFCCVGGWVLTGIVPLR